ncbi:MAG: hypothetical protein CMH56_11215 [Myxococcales bacterium]|nr:hypothetical protein [Myxococcales bacterium]|tara:strand:- start:707 stop:2026 length:1320 start_codon:yes stop_codon:yes gene_type:complete
MKFGVCFLLSVFGALALACDAPTNLNTLRLNIWQPTGAAYFDASALLTARLQTNTGYQQQFDGPAENFAVELSDLQLADTAIQIDLALTNVGVDYVGASDWLPLNWPEDDTSVQQEPALVFMGPANEVAPISTIYPHDGDIMACLDAENQLVMGSSLGDWQELSTDIHFLDYAKKSIANGPSFTDTPTNGACTIDIKNNLWVYGGCDETGNPAGALQKAPLNDEAVIQTLEQQPTRTSCNSDIWAGNALLWLSEGNKVEVRERDGTPRAEWSTDSPNPILHFIHTQPDDQEMWLVEKQNSSYGKLYLLSYENGEITEERSFFEDEVVNCTANHQSLMVCLTPKGLYSLDTQLEPQELIDEETVFQGGFEPIIFNEARPNHWVFVNAAGDQIRLIENERIKDISPERSRAQSRLFRGPGGILFWVGGNQKGIDLLATQEL